MRGGMKRAKSRLPRHMPPMNAASKNPSDTNDAPTINESCWNQTTS